MAAVRCLSGDRQLKIVDALDLALQAGDFVSARGDDWPERRFVVVVAPDQILDPERLVAVGAVVSVEPRATEPDVDTAVAALDAHSSAGLPYLGQVIAVEGERVQVVRLDVPSRRVTVQGEDGKSFEVDLRSATT